MSASARPSRGMIGTMYSRVPLLAKWLEYLRVLNLEQFDADVWKVMLRSNKRSPELAPEAIARQGEMQFCYHDMRRMFSVNDVLVPPHFVTETRCGPSGWASCWASASYGKTGRNGQDGATSHTTPSYRRAST
jgi:hypothetical protein